MKEIFLTLATVVTICAAIFPDDNNNYSVNDGASTTTQTLSECDECQIVGYAERMVQLLVAEDPDGGDLTNLAATRMDELEAYYNEVFSLFVEAEIGAVEFSETTAASRALRLERFRQAIKLTVLQMIRNYCSGDVHLDLRYHYNREFNTISLRETMTPSSSGKCWCENGKRKSLKKMFILHATKSPQMSISKVVHENTVTEIKLYYVIPQSLITKFSEVWLTGALENADSFNSCVGNLFSRLKRSMQKILIVDTEKSRVLLKEVESQVVLDLQSITDEDSFRRTFKHAFRWMSGNIFVGPKNRGPLDPELEKDGAELLEVFDRDAESIVGSHQYQILLNLRERLLKFVRQASTATPFDRLLDGFELFTSMLIDVGGHDITLMQDDLWERREPTPQELDRVVNVVTRRKMKTRKYWFVKKYDRFPRSIVELGDTEDPVVLSMEERSKKLWSDFVAELLELSLNATWSCDFARLYDDYLQSTTARNGNNCSSCASFDKFLLSKISNSSEWKSCVVNKSATGACRAWQSIVINLEYSSGSREARSELYLRDVDEFARWLLSKIGHREECQRKIAETPVLPQDPFEEQKKTGLLDQGLCYISAGVPFVVFFIHNIFTQCQQIFRL